MMNKTDGASMLVIAILSSIAALAVIGCGIYVTVFLGEFCYGILIIFLGGLILPSLSLKKGNPKGLAEDGE
jgi:hypothetical protein